MNAAAAALVVLNGRQAFDPRASLFAHNEPGFWYNPSDLSSMYQDSAGTTPVTAVEQAVGLVLDKSRGYVLGGDLAVNGAFAADSDWTKGTGWSIGSGVATKTAGSAAALSQTITSTTGRAYLISATITRTAGTLTVSIGTSGTSAAFTASYTGTFVVFAGSSTQTLSFSGDASFAGTVDNVIVRELAGNHAIQPTSASRPILRSRYNLLTYSEDFSNAAWTKSGVSVSQNAATAPDGTSTADKLIEDSSSGTHSANAATFSFSVATYVVSSYFKAAERTQAFIRIGGTVNLNFIYNLSNGTVVSGAGATIESVGDGWYRCAATFAITGAVSTGIAYGPAVAGSISYAGDNASGVFAWGAQLLTANDAIALSNRYQRIAAATDYDTVGFPVYLACDGSDDSLYTAANLDLSATDKVTVFAGVTKLSDAAQAAVVELSATVASNNGTFLLAAPDAASATIGWDSKGTAQVDAVASSSVAAPVTAVLTGIGDISGDSAILRVNGAVADTDTGDQGTGNFGAYPLYIGRRNNATLPFNGRIHQLIVRGAASSAAEISSAERWVAGKQGRAL